MTTIHGRQRGPGDVWEVEGRRRTVIQPEGGCEFHAASPTDRLRLRCSCVLTMEPALCYTDAVSVSGAKIAAAQNGLSGPFQARCVAISDVPSKFTIVTPRY